MFGVCWNSNADILFSSINEMLRTVEIELHVRQCVILVFLCLEFVLKIMENLVSNFSHNSI